MRLNDQERIAQHDQDIRTVVQIMYCDLLDHLHDTKLEWGRDDPFEFEKDMQMLDNLSDALGRLAQELGIEYELR